MKSCHLGKIGCGCNFQIDKVGKTNKNWGYECGCLHLIIEEK
jgi:hypothetical protein